MMKTNHIDMFFASGISSEAVKDYVSFCSTTLSKAKGLMNFHQWTSKNKCSVLLNFALPGFLTPEQQLSVFGYGWPGWK